MRNIIEMVNLLNCCLLSLFFNPLGANYFYSGSRPRGERGEAVLFCSSSYLIAQWFYMVK